MSEQNFRAAALSATTLGELADVVAQAKVAGAFDDRDLAWCRELWWGLDACDTLAWALLRREFPGATPLEERAS
jgi:hypothetical protein